MIPNFNEDGNLPPGIHKATWEEIETKFGNTVHRKKLLEGLKLGIKALKVVGCSKIYLDGSFITNKPRPNDYDVCYYPTFDLKLLRSKYPIFFDFENRRKNQKDKYMGEFWPTNAPFDGVYTIFEGFQVDKYTNRKKGIIELNI